MKTIGIIFLLLINYATYSQVVFGAASTTITDLDQSTYTFSYNRTAGEFWLFFIVNTKGTTPDIPTISGVSETFTQIDTKVFNTTGTSESRITAFRSVAALTASTLPTVSFGGNTQTGFLIYRTTVSGIIQTGTNGADAIVQAVTDAQDANANPVITLAAIGHRNTVLAVFGNDRNPFTGTEESGWTEHIDFGSGSPDRGMYAMYRIATTDNTPTVTASSSDWGGIAIELRAAGRRIFIIN